MHSDKLRGSLKNSVLVSLAVIVLIVGFVFINGGITGFSVLDFDDVLVGSVNGSVILENSGIVYLDLENTEFSFASFKIKGNGLVKVDILGDSVYEFDSELINEAVVFGFADDLNAYLSNCGSYPCAVPLVIEGSNIILSDLKLEYYEAGEGIVVKPEIIQEPNVEEPSVVEEEMEQEEVVAQIIAPKEIPVVESGESEFGVLGSESGPDWTSNFSSIDPDWGVSSPFGGHGEFDGAGDTMDTGDSTDWNFGIGTFTIEAWFLQKTTDFSHEGIVSQGDGDSNEWAIAEHLGVGMRWWHAGMGQFGVAIFPTTELNVWHHMVVTRNSSQYLNAYLDGKLNTSNLETFNFNSNDGVQIGKFLVHSQNGLIDEVRIYKGRSFSASEVNESYQRGLLGLKSNTSTTGLVGYWPMDTNFNDFSGNGHDGILSGQTHIEGNETNSHWFAFNKSLGTTNLTALADLTNANITLANGFGSIQWGGC